MYRLAGSIGERNMLRYQQLQEAAAYIDTEFRNFGYSVRTQSYRVGDRDAVNLEVEVTGTTHPSEVVVIGAHYDSVPGSPGADDNASGVAALLELAQQLKGRTLPRTVRLVAFTNEEMPYFQTGSMGSRVYAAAARKARENIVAMISLETIGYYSDRPGSQIYPSPFKRFYPDTGNFIGFVGDLFSNSLIRESIGAFRKTTPFPSEGLAAPGYIEGVGWSDHWAFWQEGFQAVMVTDTAPFRYPDYHQSTDLPDRLDYQRMARVVSGLNRVAMALAGG